MGDDDVLHGTWYRSFEEEQAGSIDLVYRPSGYAFPRRRAPRPSLRFGDEGTEALVGGPDDRSVPLAEVPPFTIVTSEPDRLVIRLEEK